MSEQQPLSPGEREAFARELVDEQAAITQPVEQPRAIMTAGQPGSGKSMIVRSMSVAFEGIGGAVAIDPDEVRPGLPYMRDRIARGELDIPNAAYSDAGTIAADMMRKASELSRNIIYDGTLANTYFARQNVNFLRANNYRVEIHGMAVPPDLSHARTYDRREAQIATSPTGFGRGVGDDFHDQAVRGLIETIETLQAEKAVDAIVLYDREGNEVASTRLVDGRWTPNASMADELRRTHREPDQAAELEAAKVWDRAAGMMRDRGADPVEQMKVDGFRDAATVRALAIEPDDDGAYHGPIVATDDKTVTQESAGTYVRHSKMLLTGKTGELEPGKVLSITYRGGIGTVRDPDQQKQAHARSI